MYIPAPDVAFRPGDAVRDLLAFGRVPPKVKASLAALAVDPRVHNVQFAIKEVFVINDRDPGTSDIYLATLVTDDVSAEPFSLVVKAFEGVRDQERLPLGPAGLDIYRNQGGRIPRLLDYRILVVKTGQELRESARVVREIQADGQYRSLRDSLIALSSASEPPTALIGAAADFVVGLLASNFRMKRDDQLIYVAGSFDGRFDDLGSSYGLMCHENSYVRLRYQVEAAEAMGEASSRLDADRR